MFLIKPLFYMTKRSRQKLYKAHWKIIKDIIIRKWSNQSKYKVSKWNNCLTIINEVLIINFIHEDDASKTGFANISVYINQIHNSRDQEMIVLCLVSHLWWGSWVSSSSFSVPNSRSHFQDPGSWFWRYTYDSETKCRVSGPFFRIPSFRSRVSPKKWATGRESPILPSGNGDKITEAVY